MRERWQVVAEPGDGFDEMVRDVAGDAIAADQAVEAAS